MEARNREEAFKKIVLKMLVTSRLLSILKEQNKTTAGLLFFGYTTHKQIFIEKIIVITKT